jgi:hypothetical protein
MSHIGKETTGNARWIPGRSRRRRVLAAGHLPQFLVDAPRSPPRASIPCRISLVPPRNHCAVAYLGSPASSGIGSSVIAEIIVEFAR